MKNIAVFCSSSDVLNEKMYQQADALGRWIGQTQRNLIYGGSNLGLMKAVSRGMWMEINSQKSSTQKSEIIGVVPEILIQNKKVSPYNTRQITCKDLTERKMIMMRESDVFIAMPGSIGTLDEVFSVMAQHIIGIDKKKVIFWNIDGFWDKLFELFDSLRSTGVVYKPIESLYLKANTLEEVISFCNDKN